MEAQQKLRTELVELTQARFAEATMDGSCWDASILTGADMRGISARGASFVEAVLTEVDFTGADLRGARFAGAYLVNVKGLEAAKTQGASFEGARIFNDEDTGNPDQLTGAERDLNQAILTTF